MHGQYPCSCDICCGARDDELRRAREGMAQMITDMIPSHPPGGVRLGLAIAARAIRRGRPLTEAEKLENLKAAIWDDSAQAPTV